MATADRDFIAKHDRARELGSWFPDQLCDASPVASAADAIALWLEALGHGERVMDVSDADWEIYYAARERRRRG